MVTRDEVAREAGTSSAVVSYVINNGPRNVSDATRERVLAAVAKLAYRPNAVARSLRSSSSTVLGLIVPDITNAYCGELALAVENSALERNHTLLLGNAMHDDERQAKHVETFIAHQVKGIVFIGSTYGDEAFLAATSRVLEGSKTPLVFLDRSTSEFGASTILVDNRGGAMLATRHLIEHGHREIANFTGSSGLSSVRDRTDGWADALTAAGLDPAGQQRFESAFDRYDAFAVATAMFAAGNRPRAIFSHSDEQSIGIIYAAAQAGLRIPEDVALVSFDGIKEAGIVSPGLTTVQQPIARAGALAVDLVLDGGSGEHDTQQREMLPVELIVRHSCGCR
ncbi:MAG: LacI family transcriptional regulator [Rhodoglobus sp.]|nr:LacI family transcriptional regulator [Rhodoglobus sp.]